MIYINNQADIARKGRWRGKEMELLGKDLS